MAETGYTIWIQPDKDGWHWYVGEADGFCFTLKHAVMEAYECLADDLRERGETHGGTV